MSLKKAANDPAREHMKQYLKKFSYVLSLGAHISIVVRILQILNKFFILTFYAGLVCGFWPNGFSRETNWANLILYEMYRCWKCNINEHQFNPEKV